MAATDDVLLQLIQTLPGDTPLKLLRTLSVLATPEILSAGEVGDLSRTSMVFDTEFEGPWRVSVIAVKFYNDDFEEHVPNTDPKDVGIYLLLGDEPFPLVEQFGWEGTALALTDPVKLAHTDQIRVVARGSSGFAKVEIRGEKL